MTPQTQVRDQNIIYDDIIYELKNYTVQYISHWPYIGIYIYSN